MYTLAGCLFIVAALFSIGDRFLQQCKQTNELLQEQNEILNDIADAITPDQEADIADALEGETDSGSEAGEVS